MGPVMGATEEQWLVEQVEAAQDIVHTHRCAFCEIASAMELVVLMEDNPDGVRIVMIGVCNTCATTETDGGYQ